MDLVWLATPSHGVGDPRIVAKNYHDDFDPNAYLNFYTEVTAWRAQPLRLLHELYTSYGTPPAGLKVLEFGCGPVLAHEISAPLEIVLAEYTEENRKHLQLWVDNDHEAHDWSPFFKYVVTTLEGKSEGEAAAREDQLRKLIKAVVPCDITQDPPIQAGYEGPYDVIVSNQALECAFTSLEGYGVGVSKLSKLLKSGGKLYLGSVEGHGNSHFYVIGSETFHALNLTEEKLTAILKERGFHDIQITRQPRDVPGVNMPQEADIQLLKQGEQLNAHEFFVALVSSSWSKADEEYTIMMNSFHETDESMHPDSTFLVQL